MFVTIDGLGGGIRVPNATSADALVTSLMREGYNVKINAIEVKMYYGPGYDYAIWGAGDYEGQPIDTTRGE